MPKITKQAEFLTTLRGMMKKEANGPTATGKPGGDTHFTSVDPKHDHVDKNKEGRPEHNPQDFEQKPSTDGSEPSKPKHAEEVKVATVVDTMPAKPAAEATNKVEQKMAGQSPESNTKLASLAAELLPLLEAMQKQANGPTATGKPGSDLYFTSVDPKHDHVDKNKEGRPEHNPQEFHQTPSTDCCEPAKPKHAEEVEKIASFELGRQFCRTMLKEAQAQSEAQVKTAGRRDFETLIAQAAAELEGEAEKQGAALFDKLAAQHQAHETVVFEKQAEHAGASAFNHLYKQAQYDYALTAARQAEEQLTAKLAEDQAVMASLEKKASELATKLAEKEAVLNEKIASEKRAQEWSNWASIVENNIVDRLQREARKS